jgi:hypothetical protein
MGVEATIPYLARLLNIKTNSAAFSQQANYTDWATATCQWNLVPTFADRGVSSGQRGAPTFLSSSSSFILTRAERTPFQTHFYSGNLAAPGIEPGPLSLQQEIWPLDHRGGCLLDITINNSTIRSDWKKATVVPIDKGGDRSLVSNYRPVSLISVVSQQMEHVIASYLREIWDGKDWIVEGQHGFQPGCSSESQVITVCQGNDSLENLSFKDFHLSSPLSAA